MDFPALAPAETPLPSVPPGLPSPRWTGTAGDDWLIELARAEDVAELSVESAAIAALGRRCAIVTAAADPAGGHDFVSRVFGPNLGIPEDPVTGSAHCALAAYWAPRIGRNQLTGYQASRRGGTVRMRLEGDRVVLAGRAVTVSEVDLLA